MRLTVIVSMILVMVVADICHAVDPDLKARLGIPVQPQSLGETYSNHGGSGTSVGGGCDALGVKTQLSDLSNIAQQAFGSVKDMASAAAVAALAYFTPTEYSVTANILSDARKQLSVMADKCKTYQAARDFMENKDIAGIRKAAYAKCMEQNGGDEDAEVTCSNPSNAWQYLSSQFSALDGSNCAPVIDNVLAHVNLPGGVSKNTLQSFFGNFKLCAGSSNGIAPTMTASEVYQTNLQQYYSGVVNSALSAAQSSYLSDSDIQTSGLCIGPGNGGSGGIICPHAETINMVASFPSDEQSVFMNKLAEHLSLLQTVYMTYSWASLLNKAAASAQTPVPDAFTTPITQMTSQKEKEVNDLVKLKVQANGNDGDLSNWEKQVMERNSYWQQLKASQGNETNYGSQIFGSPDSSTNNSQNIIDSIKNSYSTP
ncbi:MAG: hypothetical protein HQL08_15155 [Nitrospirae bacterium]|nr:hypothetical protein [Nitrospirota bacterium]